MPSRRSTFGLGFEGVAAGLDRLEGVCAAAVSGLLVRILLSFFLGG